MAQKPWHTIQCGEQMTQTQEAVWQSHSAQWSLVGAPLRPSPCDGSLMLELLATTFARRPTGCAIAVLGVTPEVVQLAWPAGTRLHAFDCSEEMLAAVWAPNARVHSSVTQAYWQALPLPAGQFDAVVGDGALNALPSFADYRAVLQELWRVTSPEAHLVLRCFVRPQLPDLLLSLKQAVRAGTIGSFHVLKWRLAMMLSDKTDGAVMVGSVYEMFEREFDRHELALTTGWPSQVIDTIDAYRAKPTVYTFPTFSQLAAIGEGLWAVEQVATASYELASACPTLRFKRLPARA